MRITVFTPTYNRADLLPKVLESLLKQTFRDFEWLIVDDGSKDNTDVLIKNMIETYKDKISIRYFYKTNGGKHTAINYGVKEAKGDFFLILDSDDSLPSTSLATISKYCTGVEQNSDFAGVCGMMSNHDGTLIGKPFPVKILDTTSIELATKYIATGDLLEVFKTDIMKEFPFPEITGEKFCPEVLIWNRIGTKYKLRCFTEVVYFRDYLEGGLTEKIVEIRMKSPVAAMMCYQEMLTYKGPFLYHLRAAINYWRFRFCSNSQTVPKTSACWAWTAPIAYLVHILDKYTVKKNYKKKSIG